MSGARHRAEGLPGAGRIAMVVGNFPVISETFVINQAAGLLERGCDVRILQFDGQRPPDPIPHDTVGQWNLTARSVRPLAGGWLVAPFQARDPHWSPLRRAAAFAAQAGMLARTPRFDVLHCQFASLGLETLRHLSLRSLRARRLVVHLRGQDVSQFVASKGPDIYRDLFARADLLIANCEHFRDRALDLGADPDKVIVIGSAIRGEDFALRPRYGSGNHLVSIGRLVEKKGFSYAVRGVAEAARRNPSLTYEIIGEGPLRGEIEALIADLGMTERITLSGALPHQEVVKRLYAADAMLATSVTAADGDQDAPVNSLKEGLATGLPVIATRHGGIPELVEDGVHGCLVPERDAHSIAAAIDTLFQWREYFPQMGAAGRAKTLAMYDQPVIIDRLLAAYINLFRGTA